METRGVDSWTLRPLGLGEMLDRAITLTIRNFPMLALIALAYAVPQAIFQYFGTQDESEFFRSIIEAVRSSSNGKPINFDALLKAQRNASIFSGWTAVLYGWLLVGLPIYSTAMFYAISCRYRGLAADARGSYRVTLRHWGALVGIMLVYVVIAIIAMFTLVIAAVSLIFAITLIGAGLKNTGVISAAIVLIGVVTIVMSIVIGVSAMMGYVALHFAWMANVLEGAPLVKAVTSSFARIFDRRLLRRSILFASAYFVLAAGYTTFVIAGVGLIGAFVHSNVAGIAFSTVMQIGITSFFAALFLVFYYDTRVRREGLDLELAAQALPGPATVSAAIA